MKTTSILRCLLLAAGVPLVAISSASAQATLTWDTSPGIVGPGDSVVTSGVGAWNTTNGNWTSDAGANNIAWDNLNNDNAAFGGTAGTVTLDEAISLKNLTFSNTAPTYTVTGSTLNFTAGTITASVPLTGNAGVAAIIRSNITGAPAINLKLMDGDEQFTLNPVNNGSMVIGAVSGDSGNGSEKLNLQGGTGSTGTVASVSGPKVVVSAGSWTLSGGSTGRDHSISAGTLTLNANLNATHRAVILSGTGVLNYNVAGAVSATAATATSGDNGFRITGGTLDQTSGSAINTNASTTTIDLAGTLTFAGTNGANSNLHLGSGAVFLKSGNRQVTVTNEATTLTIGGVIQNDSTGGRSLTKAGAGTLELRGANSYTGGTTVNAGTLKMGANNVIPDASNVTIGTATLDAVTRTDTAGTLNVTGTDSVINLGAGAALAFANSSAVTVGVWAGTLNITGAFVPGNDVDPSLGVNPGSIRFGVDNAGLTSAQLAAISVNGSGAGTYTLDTFGFLKASGGDPGPLDHFAISAIGSPQTVGTPITNITITAKDAANITVTSFTGTVTFGGTGGFTGTSGSFTAGVLSGVSVIPTIAGSALTFTVTDAGSGKTGSVTINTIQTQYQSWAGGALFNSDSNNDGVSNGMAFLLGAASPTSAVTAPTVSQNSGDLILNFNCLPDAARGNATLKVEHSSDLGALDPWTATSNEVPDATNAVPDNNVTFVVGAGPVGPPALNSVTATIDSDAAAGNKLFGRLKAVETP